MLEQWYNIKDKQPDLKYTQLDDMLYSDPILVMIKDTLVFARYTKQKFYGDDNVIEWDTVIEFATFDANIFDFPFDDCMTLDDAKRNNIEIYWSPLDMMSLLLSLDLKKKEEDKDGNSIITGEAHS